MTAKTTSKVQTPEAVATTAKPGATPRTSVVDFGAIPGVSAPPTATAPPVPADFVPYPGIDLQGYRPIASQVSAAPDAALEITRFADWALVFGMTAPPAAQVAQRLQAAAQWAQRLAEADAWREYVKSQTSLAWKSSLDVLGALKAPFHLVSATTPTVKDAFPALTRLLSAHQTKGHRAAATRRRRAAAKAAEASEKTAGTDEAVAPIAPETE